MVSFGMNIMWPPFNLERVERLSLLKIAAGKYPYQSIIALTLTVKLSCPRVFFYTRAPEEELKFRQVVAQEGELVGIILDHNDSQELAIIHDFTTGDSWRIAMPDGVEVMVKRKKQLQAKYERLKAENPDQQLSID